MVICRQTSDAPEFSALLDPDQDSEVRSHVFVKTTVITDDHCASARLSSDIFDRFSDWSRLALARCTLRHVTLSYQQKQSCRSWHLGSKSKSAEMKLEFERFIIKEFQHI